MAKKRRVHLSKCAFCGKSMYTTDMIVITVHVVNKGIHRDLVPTNDRQICLHKICLKNSLHAGFISLMQLDIQNAVELTDHID